MEYKNEYGRIIRGDCLEIMDKLIEEGIKVDMCFTDLPYGTTQSKWDSIIPFESMWDKLNKLVKEDGAILFFSAQPFTSKLVNSNLKDFKYELIWDKEQGTGFANAKKRILSCHENIEVFYKKQPTYNPQMIKRDKVLDTTRWKMDKLNNAECYGNIGMNDVNKKYTHKYPTSIFSYNRSMKECNNTKRLHTNQKPIDMLIYYIKTYSNEGDLILDFTSGSCSLAEACINTNRNFICIEKDEHYYEIGVNRISGYIKEN